MIDTALFLAECLFCSLAAVALIAMGLLLVECFAPWKSERRR